MGSSSKENEEVEGVQEAQNLEMNMVRRKKFHPLGLLLGKLVLVSPSLNSIRLA